MKKTLLIGAVAAALLAGAANLRSHFQMVLPSTNIVTAEGDRTVSLDILFTHPMENGPVMEMGKPRQFGVLRGGGKIDLMETLKEKKTSGKTAYETVFKVKEPGDHVFYIEPAPYWEPAERKMIIHYAKVVVSGLAGCEGWDAMAGLPVEIEPLVRPYGLWTGNLFRGIVKKGGVPVPFAEVEVEYYNEGSKVGIPAEEFVTQVIKADANGTFSYAMPRAGWWGFAALIDGDEKLPGPDGQPTDVELGGLIWVKTVDMK